MLLIVFGTRPEFLKVQPLIEELTRSNKQFYTLFTSQHIDIIPHDFTPTYTLPVPEFNSNRLTGLMIHIMQHLSNLLTDNPSIQWVMVQGDTTSALASALAAMNNSVKVIHLEAGLRTNDTANPYPEEYNRQLIARVTNIHLCPTHFNRLNLTKENVPGTKHIVGNTILDSLLPYKQGVKYGNEVLITLHRRENHDSIEEWFKVIDSMAKTYSNYKFILPIHPNPNVQQHKHLLKYVQVVNPLPHSQLIELLTRCRLVITDSGGIQEECSFFNKKVIVCRKVTERTETIDTISFLCPEPTDLPNLFAEHHSSPIPLASTCPYGDGTSSKQIVELLEAYNII